MNNRIIDKSNKIVDVGKNVKIGISPIFIAGPCTIESEEQMFLTTKNLKEIGVDILRGGAFKPRTSPYSFQGLGKEGIKILRKIGDEFNIPVVSELMDETNLKLLYDNVDIIQIGSRNMYNYSLLKILGGIDKPIILKRGMSATISEWIMAAEYIISHGNKNVILCERGIRTFDNYARNTLDLSAVPIMKYETGLPVIVDPSHGTGIKRLIEPMSKASIACGADGLMIEVHYKPEMALCDGEQSLTPEEYKKIYDDIKNKNSQF